jgi:hypothetical protein
MVSSRVPSCTAAAGRAAGHDLVSLKTFLVPS